MIMLHDPAATLAGLKDFQRATVNYAFARLYEQGSSRRFLVADEVGLGKTLIAKGIIAKAIAHLCQIQNQINIVYVCSNADIARQNIKRLRIPGLPDAAQATRLTLLPLELKSMEANPINFIALTPTTSFEQSKGGGRYDERVLLYHLLDAEWQFNGRKAAIHVLRNQAGADRFQDHLNRFQKDRVNPEIRARFAAELGQSIVRDQKRKATDLKQRFDALCDVYARSNSRPTGEEAQERTHWLGEMRQLLARVCLASIRPDLVILDEFQRFSHLLKDDNEAGELARDLFQPNEEFGARILLLSATPYRALSLHHETGDDHYSDFLSTLRFLEKGASDEIETLLADYRAALVDVMQPDGKSKLTRTVKALEDRLRRTIARTERSADPGSPGMLKEISPPNVPLKEQDVRGYLGAQSIADLIKEGDIVEYWKSSPYLFNFMDDYKLKKSFKAWEQERELIDLVRTHGDCFIDAARLANYEHVDPSNARLRGLIEETVGRGMWRLLWLPPSLRHYELSGPYAAPELQNVTKRLVFSAWHMVPRAAASLLSYEAERQMMRAPAPRAEVTQDDRLKQRGLLRFNYSADRPTGLPVMLLVYPSLTLATFCDPLVLVRAEVLSATAVRGRLVRKISELLSALDIVTDDAGATDERWYWLAPMLLDEAYYSGASKEWWHNPALPQAWGLGTSSSETDADGRWADHLQVARDTIAGVRSGVTPLGRQPDDLCEVLALAASAGPAIAALRALGRSRGGTFIEDGSVREAAGRVGHAFLSLFNHAEVIELVRSAKTDEPYWKMALAYAHAGGLQAVLDEYAHLLQEGAETSDRSDGEVARSLSDTIIEALTIRTANITIDAISAPRFTRSVQIKPERVRNRFAMRFGDQRSDEDSSAPDDAGVTRKERVRAAFNSPFWPFVLVSTSVGQEGLDFHHYCHAITHWNLPSNPVDLEQREGRVHRYKGHAVRKNVAAAHGAEALRVAVDDVWQTAFEIAARERQPDRNDLEPYWLFAGHAQIERHVPALPFSRDFARLHDLRRALAIYRMVFGQSRQEDLINYLLSQLPENGREQIVAQLRINLSPWGGSTRN